MSDFYSILRKSILDRGIVDSAQRDAIYAQARRAMIRRLWSIEPPLDEDEIERRVGAFDVAVSDIEEDVLAAFAPSEPEEPPEIEDDYAEPEPARYEANGRQPEDRDTDYEEEAYQEADYRTPRGRPDTNSRRLPALLNPADYARQVREAGLIRYHEDARRIEAEQHVYRDERAVREAPVEDDDRYDRGYDEPYDEPRAYVPPQRGRALVARRSVPVEPPVDPYADEPGYGAEPPVPRRQRQQDRWTAESPVREPKPAPKREAKQAPPKRRRSAADDDMPRRRERKRPPPRQPISDRDKIFMLLGAIGVCVLVLGGLGVYLLVPRDDGVTVDIDARHEVSDAATAVRLAATAMPIDQTFMLFDGRDPTVFETSPDNPIHFDASAGTVRISSSAGSPGVKALVGPGLATRLAGHDVRVTIVARSSKEAGAAGMRFAYQSGVAISHWQTANLGPDYQAVALTWRVPSLQTDRAGDLLVIQPGVPGDGTGADVKSIKIDLLQAQN